MKKYFRRLLAGIARAQMNFHVTGGDVPQEIAEEYETKGGKSVIYKAVRNYSERGLSYVVTKQEVNVTHGEKTFFIGITHGFGRETVNFI